MRDGVHGEGPARIHDDRVDRGRELPAEDTDSRLPRFGAPRRTAVDRGVEAAAEPPGAPRDDTRVGDRAVARREREVRSPRSVPRCRAPGARCRRRRRSRRATTRAARRRCRRGHGRPVAPPRGRRRHLVARCRRACRPRRRRVRSRMSRPVSGRASRSAQEVVTGGAVRPRCAPSSSSRLSSTAPPTPVGVAIERPA